MARTKIEEARSGLGFAQNILDGLCKAIKTVGGEDRFVEELFTDHDRPTLLEAMALVTDRKHRRHSWIQDISFDPGESWSELARGGAYCNEISKATLGIIMDVEGLSAGPIASVPVTLRCVTRVWCGREEHPLETLAREGYRSATFRELLVLGREEKENFGRTFAIGQNYTLYIESGLNNGHRIRSLGLVNTASLGGLLLRFRSDLHSDERCRDYFALVRDLSVMPRGEE